MSDDTSQRTRGARGGQDREGQLAELGLPLEELVRREARDILQRAIEAEVEQLLAGLAPLSLSKSSKTSNTLYAQNPLPSTT